MEISKGFQNLIDASLKDGKIRKEEKAILLNKAIKEGLDKDEFELYLDSLTQTKGGVISSALAGFWKWISEEHEYGFGPFKQTQSRIPGFIITLVFLIGGTIAYFSLRTPDLTDKYNCKNVEDCLSKYEFEGAREYASHEKINFQRSLRNIISSEVVYNLENDRFNNAINLIKEYIFENAGESIGKFGNVNSGYNEEAQWFNDILLQFVSYPLDDKVKGQLILMAKPIYTFKETDSDENYIFTRDNSFMEDLKATLK